MRETLVTMTDAPVPPAADLEADLEEDTEQLAADASEAAVDETAPDADHDPYRPAEPLWADDGTTYVLDWTHPQLGADFDVLDLFAAGGGWDHGARSVENIDHDKILGIEWDLAACRTAVAAGHRRLMADIALLDPRDFAARAHYLDQTIRGLIASPPCQGFSMAGDGGGRRDTPFILEAVNRIGATDLSYDAVEEVLDWLRSVCEDPKSALVLEPLRWALALGPEWLAWEQVPAVLPLWKAIAKVLRKAGWRTWVGKLVAADYGVPQTRTRAILIGSRTRHVSMPEPTHAKGGADATLFSEALPPWVSMATALGWGMTTRELVGFPRRADSDTTDGDVVTIDGVDYRARDLSNTDDPAQTVTEKARSWQRWPEAAVELRGGVMENAARRTLDEPAQTIAFGHNAAQWTWEVRDGVPIPPEGTDPADVVYVNGTGENAAVRPADEPAPTVMFGARLNTVTWRQRDDGTQVPPDGVEPIMLSGGVAGDGVPRASSEPSPTLGGKGTAVWVESTDQWVRGDRLATGETPKGAAQLAAGGKPDRRFPTRPLEPGEVFTELRRGGERINEGFDPAAEPAATVTSRVDRWQTHPTDDEAVQNLSSTDREPPADHPYWTDPAPTIVGTRRSSEGMIVGRQLPPGESVAVGGWDDRPADETPGDQIGPNRPPAANPDEATLGVWGDRPATTVVASRNADIVSGPGYRGVGAAPRQEAPGGVRVTVAEAAILQSFPADYAWQGTKSKQYEQVGNAVPPRLGAHVLAEATGSPQPIYEDA